MLLVVLKRIDYKLLVNNLASHYNLTKASHIINLLPY